MQLVDCYKNRAQLKVDTVSIPVERIMGAWNKQMIFILLGSILILAVNGAPGISLIVHANNRTATDVCFYNL